MGNSPKSAWVVLVRQDEFKEARKKLGLTQAQLAKILDRNPSTIRRYEMSGNQSSKSEVDPTVSRAMQWLLGGFRPPEWPE